MSGTREEERLDGPGGGWNAENLCREDPASVVDNMVFHSMDGKRKDSLRGIGMAPRRSLSPTAGIV